MVYPFLLRDKLEKIKCCQAHDSVVMYFDQDWQKCDFPKRKFHLFTFSSTSMSAIQGLTWTISLSICSIFLANLSL